MLLVGVDGLTRLGGGFAMLRSRRGGQGQIHQVVIMIDPHVQDGFLFHLVRLRVVGPHLLAHVQRADGLLAFRGRHQRGRCKTQPASQVCSRVFQRIGPLPFQQVFAQVHPASPIPVTISTSVVAVTARLTPAPTLSQKLALLSKRVRTSLTIEEAPVTKSATVATTCTAPVANPLAPFQIPQKKLQLLGCGEGGGETVRPPPPPPPSVINIRPVGSLYVSGLPLT